MSKKRALFLCTGNSCRSQMAEGLVNHFLAGTWRAFSAGIHPTGTVHPLTIQAMAELGIDISGQRPKSADEFHGAEFDLVVTVCDDAAENCPLWIGSGRVAHISFPDPARVTGTRDERLAAFRRVRDDIRRQILGLLAREAGDTSLGGS
jgi:arsenate reductase